MLYIYGTERCGYCDRAKELLESFNIPYTYQDVSSDQGLMDMFKRNGWKTVPQIFEDEKHIGGFDKLKKCIMGDNR